MILIYRETGQNLGAMERLYRTERFSHRRYPSPNTILRVVQRMRDTGAVMPCYEGRGPQRKTEDNFLFTFLTKTTKCGIYCIILKLGTLQKILKMREQAQCWKNAVFIHDLGLIA